MSGLNNPTDNSLECTDLSVRPILTITFMTITFTVDDHNLVSVISPIL